MGLIVQTIIHPATGPAKLVEVLHGTTAKFEVSLRRVPKSTGRGSSFGSINFVPGAQLFPALP
jgi:hypothetical protein